MAALAEFRKLIRCLVPKCPVLMLITARYAMQYYNIITGSVRLLLVLFVCSLSEY